MTTPIRAIETSYAGCRFRSRLEARWAVFFDALGIAWQYEAQGYEFESRIWQEAPFRYLPDFWLPGIGVHAEVKGTLTEPEARRLADAAACLKDLLIFGEIPALRQFSHAPAATVKTPTWLTFHKGDLLACAWPTITCYPKSPEDVPEVTPRTAYLPDILCGRVVANDSPQWLRGPYDDPSGAYFIRWVLQGSTGFVADDVEAAFAAARSARFEHGQSGAFRKGAE